MPSSPAERFLEAIPAALGSEKWDPTAAMLDMRLPDAERRVLDGALAPAGLRVSDVTVRHPWSRVEHHLTVVEGLNPPLYLVNLDLRVVDKATQANVDAFNRIIQLVKGPASVRIFTANTTPHHAFRRMVRSWEANHLSAEFVPGRNLIDFAAGDNDLALLWSALEFRQEPQIVSPHEPGPPPPAGPGGRRIFVSYSHNDADVFDRLHVHLKGLTHSDEDIDIWTDTRLKAGDEWHDEIAEALRDANIVVLLVSADFLASDFVKDEELPILDDARRRGVKVFWLKANHGYVPDKIEKFQALHREPALGTLDGDEMELELEKAIGNLLESLGDDDV